MASPTPQDPRKQQVKQPFPPQKQAPPGTEQDMQPKPDHGEKSYQGHGRLKGRKALVTGADSGIGRAVAIASRAKAPTSRCATSRAPRTRMRTKPRVTWSRRA